jgi:hypothetical protein
LTSVSAPFLSAQRLSEHTAFAELLRSVKSQRFCPSKEEDEKHRQVIETTQYTHKTHYSLTPGK